MGLDEAGIDGGGLFREFLSQLLRAAFDPNRGFFVLTKDQMLYPNPTADQIHGDSSPHYYFIGHTQNIGRIIKHLISFSISRKRRFTWRFAIKEKAPTRTFAWLKAATYYTAFTFKTLFETICS